MCVASVINEVKVVIKVEECLSYGKTAIHQSFADTRANKLCLEWPKPAQNVFDGGWGGEGCGCVVAWVVYKC